MPTSHDFGDLRSLLHRPSPASWDQLATLLASWPDDAELRGLVLPYCREQMRSWPDRLRSADSRWIERLMMRGERVFQRYYPILSLSRRVAFSENTFAFAQWQELLNLDCWSELDSLKLDSLKFGGKRGFGALLGSNILTPLRHLHLRDFTLTDPMLTALLDRLAALPDFESLELERCHLSAPQLQLLLDHELTPTLLGLGLQDNRLKEQDIALLAQSHRFARLEKLMLGARPEDPYYTDRHHFYNTLGPSGLAPLAEASAFPALIGLELGYTELSVKELMALAHGMGSQLRMLDLQHNELEQEAEAALLFETSMVRHLEHVNLSDNALGKRAISALVEAPRERALRTLMLSRTGYGKQDVRALINSPVCETIERLELMDNELNEEVLELFVEQRFPSLCHLSLAGNVFADSVMAELVASPMIDQLRVLDLRSTNIGPRTLSALKQREGFPRMEHFCLSTRAKSPELRRTLMELAPHTQISYEHYTNDPTSGLLFHL